MMRWGRKKPVSSSSSSSSSGNSRAFPVSWFSKLSCSSDLKPAKEKKQDDEATCGFLEVDAMDRNKGTVIMTPRIHFKRDKQRCERRDKRLLQQKPKRSEQDLEVKTKKPARRTCTESCSKEDSVILGHTATESAHQWQKLKEVKLRGVKLKADQYRKSLYLKRKLNNKVRVFSPRASEKCRVKAIEDLKKAKVRAWEHEHVIETADGGMENESFALVKCSSDPQKDFRDSMIEMIMENGINHPEQLKELLILLDVDGSASSQFDMTENELALVPLEPMKSDTMDIVHPQSNNVFKKH